MYALTIFRNLYDNKTDKRMNFQSFDELEALLYGLSEKPYASKRDAQLISPAVFDADTTRSNKSVTEWGGWAAVDVDDHVFDGDLEKELKEKYGNFYYVCYSTASSSVSHPKFRLVFPLSSSVDNVRIKHFWYALNSELGGIGDKQTKDLSRMYFIPGSYANAHNFIFSNHDGNFINPDELMAKWEYSDRKSGDTFMDRLPEAWIEMIMNTRKSQMDNVNVSWSSYRDCPFWPNKLASEYVAITNTGWYRKMYSIMVALAGNAIRDKYPITSNEIALMISEFDKDTGNWYENRPLLVEADRAIEYVYRSGV